MWNGAASVLPTGGSPAAAWAETASVYGWSLRCGWPTGPAPWCRRSAVHQNNVGSLDPPLALWPQSQNTTITLTDFIQPHQFSEVWLRSIVAVFHSAPSWLTDAEEDQRLHAQELLLGDLQHAEPLGEQLHSHTVFIHTGHLHPVAVRKGFG